MSSKQRCADDFCVGKSCKARMDCLREFPGIHGLCKITEGDCKRLRENQRAGEGAGR